MSSSHSTTAGNKIEFVCTKCGGTDLLSDAPCTWDANKQEWVKTGEVDDDTYCRICEENVKITTRDYFTDAELAKAFRRAEIDFKGSGAYSGCITSILDIARRFRNDSE